MKIKRASKDFGVSDLPSNRKEVFFDCIKNRFRYLFRCGLILFLSMIPILVVAFIKSMYISSFYEAFNASSITQEEYSSYSLVYSFIFDLLIIVSSFIASLGISGTTRVIRQIGWEEPLFFSKDFFDGIKMNYKHICGHTFFLSLIYMIADLSLVTNMSVEIFKYIPYAVFLFVVVPAFLYNLVISNVYDIKNVQATKNSLLLYLKSVPVCMLFSLVVALTTFVNYITNFSIVLLVYVLIILLIAPLFYLAWFLYSSYVLDKFINKEFYPEIVDKGFVRKVVSETDETLESTKEE